MVAAVCHSCVYVQESNAVRKVGLQDYKLIDVKIMYAPGETRHHANTEEHERKKERKNSNPFERTGDNISALSGYATSVTQSEKVVT